MWNIFQHGFFLKFHTFCVWWQLRFIIKGGYKMSYFPALCKAICILTSTACPPAPSSINRDWINQVQPSKHFWWHWRPVKWRSQYTAVIWYSATSTGTFLKWVFCDEETLGTLLGMKAVEKTSTMWIPLGATTVFRQIRQQRSFIFRMELNPHRWLFNFKLRSCWGRSKIYEIVLWRVLHLGQVQLC